MPVDPILAGAIVDGSRSPVWSNTRILGVRLRKFSLYHRLLLKIIDSPFVTGKPILPVDLRRAVGICRLGFGDSCIRKPVLVPSVLFLWGILRALMIRAKPGELNPLQKALKRRCEAFVEYTADYLQQPEYAVIPPKAASGMTPRDRAPDEIEHVAELIHWSHYSRETIWNLPIGEANWLRVFARRDAGVDVDFNNDSERAFQEMLPPEYRRE